MYPVDYGKWPLNCGLCLLDRLRSKRKTGEGKGEGARKTKEEAYGEGKGNESPLNSLPPTFQTRVKIVSAVIDPSCRNV